MMPRLLLSFHSANLNILTFCPHVYYLIVIQWLLWPQASYLLPEKNKGEGEMTVNSSLTIILLIRQQKISRNLPEDFRLPVTKLSNIATPWDTLSSSIFFKYFILTEICTYLFLVYLPSLECKLHKSMAFMCFVHGYTLSTQNHTDMHAGAQKIYFGEWMSFGHRLA